MTHNDQWRPGTRDRSSGVVGRRAFLAGTVATGLTVAVGCGPTGGGATGKASSSPKRGGVLKMAINEEPFPHAYDMMRIDRSTGTRNIAYFAYDGLVNMSPKGEVEPELAKSFERKNATTFVFELRKGIEFQDGTKLDAKAVKANFDRLQSKRLASPLRIPYLESWRVVGPYDVELTLSRPHAGFLTVLRRDNMPIQSPAAWEKYGSTDSFKASVGTGGYRFVSYRKGDSVKLERFDGYWRETNYFDQVEAKIIPEAATQLQALQSGQVHVAKLVPAQLAQVERDPSIKVEQLETTSVDYLAFNQKRSPFDKLEVRQAFSQAIDRAGIVKAVYHGGAVPAHGPLSAAFGRDFVDLGDVEVQNYDTAAAKKALQDASFDLGTKVPFASFNSEPWSSQADIIQEALKQIGVKADLHKTDFPTFAATAMDKRDYTIANSQENSLVDAGEQLMDFYGEPDTSLNITNALDEKLLKLVEQASRTYDAGKRADLYHEASRRAAEQVHYAFIACPKYLVGHSDKLQGYRNRPGGGAIRTVAECWLA